MAVSRREVIVALHQKRIFSSSVKYSGEFRSFLVAHFDRQDDESFKYFKEQSEEVVTKLRSWLGQTPKAKSLGKSRAKLSDILRSSKHKVALFHSALGNFSFILVLGLA